MTTNITKEALTAIASMLETDEFTQNDILSLVPKAKFVLSQLMTKQVRSGVLKVVNPKGRPHRYVRVAAIHHTDGRKTTPNEIVEIAKPISNEIVEIDPQDIFQQIPPEDFGHLVGDYLAMVQARAEPMRLRLVELHQRVTNADNEKEAIIRRYESDLAGLRRELRGERERIENLQSENDRLREQGVIRDRPVRKIVIERRTDHKAASNYKPIVIHKPSRGNSGGGH